MDLPRTASAVVIGAGVVGCSIAYHLASRGMRDVLVVERDQVGAGTTSKAAGGIRVQFATETEIRFSLESIAAFERSIRHEETRFDRFARVLFGYKFFHVLRFHGHVFYA